MLDRDALREQAVRLHLRYVHEVVVAFGFCPWAAAALARGRVRTAVVFGEEPTVEASVSEVVALEADPAADIGFLIFPQSRLDALSHQHFAASVRAAYEPPGQSRATGFALADFHPAVSPDASTPARLVPFIRASPDPTLQLVRHSVLAEVRRGDEPTTRFVEPALVARQSLEALSASRPPVHARIAAANFATLSRLGIERVTAVLRDIAADRERAYSALGLAPPPWRGPL